MKKCYNVKLRRYIEESALLWPLCKRSYFTASIEAEDALSNNAGQHRLLDFFYEVFSSLSACCQKGKKKKNSLWISIWLWTLFI